MATKFKIHPAIGIARLGNSPDSFYLAPETPGGLPIDCDEKGMTKSVGGKEVTITSFRDAEGRLRRQGARFQVHRYDSEGASGREVALNEPIELTNPRTGQRIEGTLQDITWTAYIANKKAIWYEFKETDGEHGYAPDHPLRNADITSTAERQRMIIDPGPRTVSLSGQQRASFAREDDAMIAQSFPPPLSPCSITTLGDLIASVHTGQTEAGEVDPTKVHARLVLLGGHGNSGSYKTGPGEPKIDSYVNNDGWFDDESDGYVKATLIIKVEKINGEPPLHQSTHMEVPVDEPSWVIIGYPRYAPQILDMVTMEDAMSDVFVRTMAQDIELYGVPPFDGTQKPPSSPDELSTWRRNAQWNPAYYPRFWRDIWPILQRPNQFQWVMDFDQVAGGDPHDTSSGGNLDPGVLALAPYEGQDPAERRRNAAARQFIHGVLRKPGQENLYTIPTDATRRIPGMPLLCGDNPITNTSPSKFLRLTSTMLFFLKQWADGRFINEKAEHIPLPSDDPAPASGEMIDRGVLSNLLGGALCPGAEATWIIRNPAIYTRPYRIKLSPNLTPGCLSLTDNIAVGLEPGDLTKRNGVPWQADFNECSTQPIDITYEGWNAIYPSSTGESVTPIQQTVYWWPSHRPMMVVSAKTGSQVSWSGTIPQESTGDLAMVTAWKHLGFVCDFKMDPEHPNYVLIEGWNSEPPVRSGSLASTSSGGTKPTHMSPDVSASADPSRST